MQCDNHAFSLQENENGQVEVNIEEKMLKKSHNVKQEDGTVAEVVQEVHIS